MATRQHRGDAPVTTSTTAEMELADVSQAGRGWHGNPEGHAEAGRKGGRVAHERGRAHRFTHEEAREAGKKGGRTAHARGTAHEFNSDEARQAGKKGAASRSGTH